MPPKTPRAERIEDEPPIGINPHTGEFYSLDDKLIVVDPDDDGSDLPEDFESYDDL